MHSLLKKAIDDAGGVSTVALASRLTRRAITKWIGSGRLPRTDYTGKTAYWRTIQRLARGQGVKYTKRELLVLETNDDT